MATALSVEVHEALSAERKAVVLSIVQELQAAGATSLRAIAQGLNAQGLTTSRDGSWGRPRSSGCSARRLDLRTGSTGTVEVGMEMFDRSMGGVFVVPHHLPSADVQANADLLRRVAAAIGLTGATVVEVCERVILDSGQKADRLMGWSDSTPRPRPWKTFEFELSDGSIALSRALFLPFRRQNLPGNPERSRPDLVGTFSDRWGMRGGARSAVTAPAAPAAP